MSCCVRRMIHRVTIATEAWVSVSRCHLQICKLERKRRLIEVLETSIMHYVFRKVNTVMYPVSEYVRVKCSA